MTIICHGYYDARIQMLNGNTLLTTWSQESVNSTTYKHTYRSYELADGVFLPVATVDLGNGSLQPPEMMTYYDDIVIDGQSSTTGPTGSSNTGLTISTRNRSALPIDSLTIPSQSGFGGIMHVIFDKQRKKILCICDCGSSFGRASSASGFSTERGWKDGWVRFFVINYDDTGHLTRGSENNTFGDNTANLLFKDVNLKEVGMAKLTSVQRLFTLSPDGRFFTYPSFNKAAQGIHISDTKNEDYTRDTITVDDDKTANPYVISKTDFVTMGLFPDILKWTADSRYFITAVNGTTAAIKVYKQIDDKFTEVSRISNIPRNVTGVIPSPDNRTLAVTVFGMLSSHYDTLIYQRNGDSFTLVQTLNDVGSSTAWNAEHTMIAFNGDGSILIDSAARRAFRIDNTGKFNEDTQLMSKIVAGATVNVLSDHLIQPPTNGFIYDNTVPYFINNPSVDLNLKICLLSKDATFHHEHKTLTDVTGAIDGNPTMEISGSGWETGGELIKNAKLVKSDNGSVMLTGDNLAVDIAGSALRFSKAVIYNATTLEPWLWFDFGSEIIIESGTTMNINFSSRGFLIFAP